MNSMTRLAYATLFLGLLASSAPAGEMIRKACLKAGRDGASAELCTCIQLVADQNLKRKDQRMAAGFFRVPHRAQVIRQSNKIKHAAFWQRYKAFGLAAKETCEIQKAS